MTNEKEALAICTEARNNSTPEDAKVAEIIYANIFGRDERYRDWATAQYQAPETHEGFALYLCLYTAMKIRGAHND